jgi:hypothetical protein
MKNSWSQRAMCNANQQQIHAVSVKSQPGSVTRALNLTYIQQVFPLTICSGFLFIIPWNSNILFPFINKLPIYYCAHSNNALAETDLQSIKTCVVPTSRWLRLKVAKLVKMGTWTSNLNLDTNHPSPQQRSLPRPRLQHDLPPAKSNSLEMQPKAFSSTA